MRTLCFVIFISAISLSATIRAEQAFQSHEIIYAAIRDYIAEHISSVDYETNIAAVDDLLRLPECPEPLEIFTTGELIKAGRNTLGVRCNKGNKWSIFTFANIKTFEPVLVVTKALQRGNTITRQHLSLERRDVSRLNGNFISEFDQVENKRIIRPIHAGSIVSMRHIAEPHVVKRGEKLTINFEQPGFAIHMNGLALMDGIKGQQIKIKNQSSGRIINATVIDQGLVSVNH